MVLDLVASLNPTFLIAASRQVLSDLTSRQVGGFKLPKVLFLIAASRQVLSDTDGLQLRGLRQSG